MASVVRRRSRSPRRPSQTPAAHYEGSAPSRSKPRFGYVAWVLVCLRSEESPQQTHEPSEPTADIFSAPPIPGRDRLRLGAPESRSGVSSGSFEALVPGTEPFGQVPLVGPGVSVADQLLVHHGALHGHEGDDAGVLVAVQKPELRSSLPGRASPVLRGPRVPRAGRARARPRRRDGSRAGRIRSPLPQCHRRRRRA